MKAAETKAAFKTTEFMVYLAAVVGVLIASYLVGESDGRGDVFLADTSWLTAFRIWSAAEGVTGRRVGVVSLR